ncbi:hypothetical protein HanLR1_Chr02g0049331 [Helianthus annuus]|nr:hypothetical protein HanHA89_Chr02g0051571 [Helianthus annuus]KAJ0776759.1 hypothetical protein HanLR1_Chr02g0049331 [Helianthus annuus]
MKIGRSPRTRRLLDVLNMFEAAESLLLLASSPPLSVIGAGKLISSVHPSLTGVSFELCPPEIEEETGVLSAEALMARFPMLQPGGCKLVYRRRQNCRVGHVTTADATVE